MTIPERLLCALGGVVSGVLGIVYARAIYGSRPHPLMALTGAVFMYFLAPQCESPLSAGRGVLFFTILLVVAVCDWSVLRIPNVVVGAGAFAALAVLPFDGIEAAGSRIASAVGAGAIMLALYAIGSALFRREAMGFGDVKLGAMLGCYLDPEAFLLCLWFAAIIGLIAALIIGTVNRSGRCATSNPHSGRPWGQCDELPFGSFLCVSAAGVYLFGDTLLPAIFSLLMPL